MNRVGEDYFRTMGTAMIAGRTFGPQDRPGATETAIVNEMLARKYFGTGNPIGRTFQIDSSPGEPSPFYQVVGVVKDTIEASGRLAHPYRCLTETCSFADFVQLGEWGVQ
jgi:hypothetical protein